MSSRNKLLNSSERTIAGNVIRLLKKAKKLYKSSTKEETKFNIRIIGQSLIFSSIFSAVASFLNIFISIFSF